MLFFIMLWLSVTFLLLELFLPGMLLFCSVSFGFLCVAFASFLISNLWLLFGFWLVGNLIAFVVTKQFVRRSKLCRTEDASDDTNVTGMIGQACVVVRELPNGNVLVVFGFEEWLAVPLSQDDSFVAGERVSIVRVVGNRVIIKKIG